ncbi:MAG: glycosyltransferase family 4 protein [Dehalococcoidia bacterium]|nr:glycosyltransferase family 4 protein [Dehalococcoidia bacterium]
MKIALVSPYDFPYPGGVTEHISHLEEHFTRWGHRVKILAPSSGDREALAKRGVLVVGKPVSIPANGSIARITLSLRLAGQVKAILRQEQFDIVHFHEPLLPALPLQVLRFSDAVNIGTFHTYRGRHLAYHYGKRILKRWFRKLDGKIAVSLPAMEFVRQYFPGYYNIIPNGIDYDCFAGECEPLPELNDGKLNILFVGRLEKRKGLRYLLEAFQLVKNDLPSCRLVIVGPVSKGAARYQEWARHRGLADVVFTGMVSHEDLPRYYHSAHIFCSPATGQESFGIVLLEAMAAGRPIVASDIEGYRLLVEPGVDGLLVPPKDKKALAEALLRLASDPVLRTEMGEAGRRKAKHYTWSAVAGRVLNYYQRLLSERYPRTFPLDARLIPAEG